jgi:hypothetical protein
MAGRIGAQAEAEQYARRALIELHRAWEQGWKEIQLMERDPDLDALRERADFRRLMDELKAGRR